MHKKGSWKEKVANLENIVKDCFTNISSSINPTLDQIEDVLVVMEWRVIKEINILLVAFFTKEKVYTTLSNMSPDKMLGSDGFATLFYQKILG